MKKIMMIFTVLMLLAAIVFVYCYIRFQMNVHLTVDENASTSYVLSLDDPVYTERFMKDRILMADNAVKGPVYIEDIPPDGDGLEYVLYTLRITNNNLAEARSVELTLNYEYGDILYYMPDENETIIEPGKTKDVSCLLLRKKKTGNTVRDIDIHYLIFGKSYKMRYIYDE